MTQIEHASDLREVPAQPPGELGTADALAPHRFVQAVFAIPSADSGTNSSRGSTSLDTGSGSAPAMYMASADSRASSARSKASSRVSPR